MFESILIANRGEIACRIMRTCRRLGIRSIAVYSEADRDALFVELADEAYPIGAAEPLHSYLNVPHILAAAKAARASAIHPGYGFLSENAAFAEACAASRIVFIGPPPAAIRAMGLKHEAKALMEKASVRVLPGYRGEAQELSVLVEAARAVGYPLLIKAVAGGGGKGLRRVDSDDALARALDSAQREARAAFGDGRVLIEKYLARSRHIEVQVFADRSGRVVHLFTRDCSLQRRHQKIIEEAPPPGCSSEFEEAACALAVRATQAIAYEGAGTIELIADVSKGIDPERVYFMEMNTRLQVEHPVTEAITGIDLVEWQIRVASGEPLPRTQAEIKRQGHAFEARVYAEDPARDFMPQIGTLRHFAPPSGEHVRVDAGFRTGDRLSIHYDALLAKVIVWGDDRAVALRRLSAALRAFEVAGVTTNLGLLSALAAHPAMRAGDVHTGFIAAHPDALFAADAEGETLRWVLACVGRLERRDQRAHADPSPWADARAFRVNQPHADRLAFFDDDVTRVFRVVFDGACTLIDLPGHTVTVRDVRFDGPHLTCTVDDRRVSCVYVEEAARCFVVAGGGALEATFAHVATRDDDDVDGAQTVRAPMPGRIHAVLVREGDRVTRGQALLSLEAMKMEHTLRAPSAGTVSTLHARVGEQVEEGQLLFALRDDEET